MSECTNPSLHEPIVDERNDHEGTQDAMVEAILDLEERFPYMLPETRRLLWAARMATLGHDLESLVEAITPPKANP